MHTFIISVIKIQTFTIIEIKFLVYVILFMISRFLFLFNNKMKKLKWLKHVEKGRSDLARSNWMIR